MFSKLTWLMLSEILLFVGTVLSHDKPNILLILIDDLGNADAGFNYRLTNPSKASSPPILTPNMDYLANNGIIFDNHYTQPVCGPSRCTLLTSRYSYRLGNPFPAPNGNSRDDLENIGAGDLGPNYRTFVHELSDRGYVNHFIGKYGIDNHDRYYKDDTVGWLPKITTKIQDASHHSKGPLSRGFDTFYGFYASAHNHFSKRVGGDIMDWHKFNETHILEYPDLDNEPLISSTHIFTRETIVAMQRSKQDKKPFFIHLSYSMPHDPLMVDDKYLNMNDKHCTRFPHFRRRIYCGMVASVDEGIGNITKYMKQNNLLSNTIIYLTSDNGGFPFVGGYNYPYRGQKGSIYDGGVRTPAFIYSQQHFPRTSGLVYHGLLHLVDVGPTFLSLVNETGKQLYHKMGNIDGIDLKYTLQNFVDKDVVSPRNELIVDANGWTNSTSYIDGDYKLVLGFAGGMYTWYEPDDEFTMNSKFRDGARLKIPDYFNHFLNKVFGADYYLYELTFAGFAGRLADTARNELNSPICRHADGFPRSAKDQRPLYIPSIDWNDEFEKRKIRLYNLKTNPGESINIAFERRDIVENIMNKLRKRLINERDDLGLDVAGALHYNLYMMFRKILFGIFIGFVSFLVIMYGFIRYCCCKSVKTGKPKTE